QIAVEPAILPPGHFLPDPTSSSVDLNIPTVVSILTRPDTGTSFEYHILNSDTTVNSLVFVLHLSCVHFVSYSFSPLLIFSVPSPTVSILVPVRFRLAAEIWS